MIKLITKTLHNQMVTYRFININTKQVIDIKRPESEPEPSEFEVQSEIRKAGLPRTPRDPGPTNKSDTGYDFQATMERNQKNKERIKNETTRSPRALSQNQSGVRPVNHLPAAARQSEVFW